MNIDLKIYEEILRDESKYENCCYYIYGWIVKILQPFSKLGI